MLLLAADGVSLLLQTLALSVLCTWVCTQNRSHHIENRATTNIAASIVLGNINAPFTSTVNGPGYHSCRRIPQLGIANPAHASIRGEGAGWAAGKAQSKKTRQMSASSWTKTAEVLGSFCPEFQTRLSFFQFFSVLRGWLSSDDRKMMSLVWGKSPTKRKRCRYY